MPTPSPGIIIAASVLVAAGVAFYNDPQVQEWLETSRRKIAVALSSLGDDLNPQQHRYSQQEQTAAQRKHAIEQARKKRDEVLANDKSRDLFMRKRGEKGRSFDDFLVQGRDDGTGDGEGLVRGGGTPPSNRSKNSRETTSLPEVGITSTLSADEARNIIHRDGYPFVESPSRTQRPSSTPSPAADSLGATQAPAQIRTKAPQQLPALETKISADEGEEDEKLVSLTPTTSASTVSLVSLPSASAGDRPMRPSSYVPEPSPPLEASFHSFSTNSSLPSEAHPSHPQQATFSPPQVITFEDDVESVISDADFMSDAGPTGLTPTGGRSGRSTPDSWMEVGSEVSGEGDYGGTS